MMGTILNLILSVKKNVMKMNEEIGEDQLEELEYNLGKIYSVLHDAETKQVNELMKVWLKNLEDVALEAEYVLDVLRPIKSKKQLGSMIKSVPLVHKCVEELRDRSSSSRGINEKLEPIKREASRLYNTLASLPLASSSEGVTSSVGPPRTLFLGRDDDVSTVVNNLVLGACDSSPKELRDSVLAIVGPEGFGKTTLAERIYHKEKIRDHFNICMWVNVSRDFNSENKLQPQMQIKKIEQALERKTSFLLVLDDVGNQEGQHLKHFVYDLPETWSTRCSGNIILAITRDRYAAKCVGTLGVHELKGLSENDCWSIIKEQAFTGAEFRSAELEGLGREIAKKCHGSPLVANQAGVELRRRLGDEWLRWITRNEQHEEFDNLFNLKDLTSIGWPLPLQEITRSPLS